MLDSDRNLDTRTRKYYPFIKIEEIFDNSCAQK